MMYYTSTHADVAESFLLGLSCLVGGDQFFILVSKTDASPKTQSYIAITAVLSTLFLAFVFYDEYNRSLFDVTHVLYLVLLVIWGLILYQNVKNPFVTTYYTSMLGMVMTFLVIISCVHYSHQKELLPSFLSGMLCARLLPILLWIFVHEKKAESKSNLSSLSARLALFRLIFCIISMILKFTSGNLDFSQISFYVVESKDRYQWSVISKCGFMNFAEKFNKSYIDRYYCIKYLILAITTSLFLFFSSIILYLGLSPIVHKFSYLYSHHLYSRIDIVKTLSHLLGAALGTKYPVSKTANFYYFPSILLGYGVYIFGLATLNNRFKFTSPIHLYTVVILTGTVLGYIWSYSLILIKNLFFMKTCIYEEKKSSPCCGDKTESQCYCRLEPILKSVNYGSSDKMFDCSILLYDHLTRLKYSESGRRAILLMYHTDYPKCSQVCAATCQTCDGDCCLRLVGIYKIETVTTNTCDNCQLTIRFEGTCCNSEQCPTCCGSGGSCACGQGKCCCICVKCCTDSCQPGCKCCIHVCNGNGRCGQCFGKFVDYGHFVRVFICFKNGNSTCCIREIKPNLLKEFNPDLKVQNDFDIKSISFFDCCHTDLILIIECSMKNNFFRSTPINYPKKTIKPHSLTLMRNGIECCKTDSGTNCCCKNSDLVTVCVKYEGSEPNCKIECECQGGNPCCSHGSGPCGCCRDGKCCCCVTCELNVNKLSYFYETIESVRVKLVLMLWFLVLIFLMIAISLSSKIKNKKLKYYQFFPIRSFETVNTYVDKNDMNSIHSVLERLTSAQQNIFLELFGESDKKNDLDHMLQLCNCAFDPCSLNRLRHYVLSRSSMLIANPHYINRRLNLELVKWSYCVGFIYTYIILMFFRIQNYFLKWEQVWEMEYLNYKRIMTSNFNNLTQKSKSSMSLMCEKSVDHKTTLYTDTSKKKGWDCSHDELDIHANLNERETEMNKDPPYRLDLRLTFYLDKWKHRVENLRFWTENETNVYDWNGLINEYQYIRSWFFRFLPHIQAASHQLDIPMDKLNKGTEILQTKNLSLIS